jgi:flagellar protein FlaG
METKLNLKIVEPAVGVTPAPAPPSPQSAASVMQNDPADLRLVIEPDPGVGGGYVYKTIDRRTGAVVLELPRSQVAQLPQTEDYAAGSVVRAKA